MPTQIFRYSATLNCPTLCGVWCFFLFFFLTSFLFLVATRNFNYEVLLLSYDVGFFNHVKCFQNTNACENNKAHH